MEKEGSERALHTEHVVGFKVLPLIKNLLRAGYTHVLRAKDLG